MFDDFLIRASVAGIVVALAAGPLGCFVVWRRMAFFGDACAHAALLGVAFALAWDIPILFGVLVVTLLMAFGGTYWTQGRYAIDTVLGVFSVSALAAGLVAMSLLQGPQVDLMSYLFGDVLAVTAAEAATISAIAAAIVGLLIFFWKRLLLTTISEELAWADGVNPRLAQLGVTILLAVLVGIAIKIIGVLLIAALLILPAAAARPLAQSPHGMAILAATIGAVSVIAGLGGSVQFDLPTGPAIVLAATSMFLLAILIGVMRRS